MKKILHIPNFYPPHTGGIEDVCYNIVNITKRNPNVHQKIICFSGTKETVHDIYENIEVIRIGAIKKIASQYISFNYIKELRKVIAEFQPDIVHFHKPNPLVAFFLFNVLPKNVKLIVHWHSDIVAQKYLYYFVKGIEKKILKRADIIISTSPNYIEDSKPLQNFKEKVLVVQNIIEPKKFEFNETIEKQVQEIRTHHQNKPIVLFVGRHVAYKGLQFLVEAEPYISNDCVIIIAGKGKQTNYLKSICKSGRVNFIGRIPDELLIAYYYAADIFAFPSITKNEAFGVALAEAMYCKTPAITFTIKGSGVNWVSLNNETGLEVENGNMLQLANAIDTLLSNKNLKEKYAENARKRIEENFTSNKIQDIINQLYK